MKKMFLRLIAPVAFFGALFAIADLPSKTVAAAEEGGKKKRKGKRAANAAAR